MQRNWSARHSVHQGKPFRLEYIGIEPECGYRLSILVADAVVVGIKSVESLAPIHEVNLLTYLKLGAGKLGLLINFNVAALKNGIKQKVPGFEE